VVNDRKECKYRLRGDAQIIFAGNNGFSRNELLKMRQIKNENFQFIIKSWEDYVLRGRFAFWESIDQIIGIGNLLNGSIVPK